MKATEVSEDENTPTAVALLRQAIRAAAADGVSARELARRSGVHLGGILLFTKGERDLTFNNAALLCSELGLQLVKAKGRKRKRV